MDRSAVITLALELPETQTVESANGDSVDVRVRNRTFLAIVRNLPGVALFRLTPEQQALMIEAEPAIFSQLGQFLGGKGWTTAQLALLDPKTAKSVLRMAWAELAPQKLVRAVETS